MPEHVTVAFMHGNTLIPVEDLNGEVAVQQGYFFADKVIRNRVIVLVFSKANVVVLHHGGHIPMLQFVLQLRQRVSRLRSISSYSIRLLYGRPFINRLLYCSNASLISVLSNSMQDQARPLTTV